MTASAAQKKVPSNLAETFYTALGEQILYVPVAKRIDLFLESYPPTDFAIMSEVKIVQERFVVETRLSRLDDGKTIANAHSSGIPGSVEHKELERLETASLQRLMARLGFGGDVFDDDESLDFKITKLSRSDPKTPVVKIEDEIPQTVKAVKLPTEAVKNPEEMPTVTTPVATAEDTARVDSKEVATTTTEASDPAVDTPSEPLAPAGDLLDQAECDDANTVNSVSAKTTPLPSRPSAPKGMSEDAKMQAKLNNLRKQINQQALRKGVPAPDFETIEEATEILRRIVSGGKS